MNNLRSFILTKKGVAALLTVALIIIAISYFYFWQESGPSTPDDVEEKQTEIVNDVKDDLKISGTFSFWENQGVVFDVDFSKSDIQKVSEDSYVYQIDSVYSIDELRNKIKLATPYYQETPDSKFEVSGNYKDFVNNYANLLTESLSEIPLESRPTFKLIQVGTNALSLPVEGSDYGNTQTNITHIVYTYELKMNDSRFAAAYGANTLDVWAPTDPKGKVVVSMPKFFPKKIKVHSKRAFKDGVYKVTPSLALDPSFFNIFFEVGFDVFKKGDFAVKSETAQLFYVYDVKAGYIAPFLSKEAMLNNSKIPRPIPFLLTSIE